MGYWNSRGLRGNSLEEQINLTNEMYRSKGIALVQKIPTPIKPIEINQKNRTISLAYFEQKSTVDYIGVVQKISICFDAKETSKKSFPISNIHLHQVEFMDDFEKQGGIAFLLVYFSFYNEHYFLPYETIITYWENSRNGGRKSIPYRDFNKEYLINIEQGVYIHYLKPLQKHLEKKQK